MDALIYIFIYSRPGALGFRVRQRSCTEQGALITYAASEAFLFLRGLLLGFNLFAVVAQPPNRRFERFASVQIRPFWAFSKSSNLYFSAGRGPPQIWIFCCSKPPKFVVWASFCSSNHDLRWCTYRRKPSKIWGTWGFRVQGSGAWSLLA